MRDIARIAAHDALRMQRVIGNEAPSDLGPALVPDGNAIAPRKHAFDPRDPSRQQAFSPSERSDSQHAPPSAASSSSNAVPATMDPVR